LVIIGSLAIFNKLTGKNNENFSNLSKFTHQQKVQEQVTASLSALIGKEISLEWRQKTAFGGIMLYLLSTVFVCYLSFHGVIHERTWNALFWIIMLFASLNAVLKGFIADGGSRMLYYYTLVPAHVIITSKILYNAMLMIVLSFAGLLVFIAFMGNPVENTGLFLAAMLLGVTGLSAVMTMVSAIASKARNNFTLMGVLSFPLVLPLVLVLIRVSEAALAGAGFRTQLPGLLVLLLLTAIAVVLANILYPYIWKD
jgi:heme exporter protein B